MKIRIYLDILDENNPVLTEDNVHYLLHVLKITSGTRIFLFNHLRELECIAYVEKKNIAISVVKCDEIWEKLPNIHLVQAVLKGDKMCDIMGNSVQLGMTEFTAITTQNCHIRNINLERITLVAKSTLQQCGGQILPQIHPLSSFSSFFSQDFSKSIILYGDLSQNSGNISTVLRKISSLSFDKIFVIIGPEGGFSDEETQQLRGISNGIGIQIGSRIMRAESAATSLMTFANLCYNFS